MMRRPRRSGTSAGEPTVENGFIKMAREHEQIAEMIERRRQEQTK